MDEKYSKWEPKWRGTMDCQILYRSICALPEMINAVLTSGSQPLVLHGTLGTLRRLKLFL